MFSVSDVVKPTPVNADRAWNRAISRDTPVYTMADDAILVMINPSEMTTNNVIIGTTITAHTLDRYASSRYASSGWLALRRSHSSYSALRK